MDSLPHPSQKREGWGAEYFVWWEEPRSQNRDLVYPRLLYLSFFFFLMPVPERFFLFQD